MESKIIEKIQKLLSMTTENGCTEAEAAEAASLVQRLLLQNGLDMSSIPSDKKEKNRVIGTCHDTEKAHRTKDWQELLANSVASAMCCRLIIRSYKSNDRHGWVFLGKENDSKAASILFSYLISQFYLIATEAWLQAYKNRGKIVNGVLQPNKIGRGFFPSYLMGMTVRVSERMEDHFNKMVEELKAESYVLETYNEVDDFLKAMNLKNGKPIDKSIGNRDAFLKGMKDAEKVRFEEQNQIGENLGPKALGS
jgi:hypothetical protein